MKMATFLSSLSDVTEINYPYSPSVYKCIMRLPPDFRASRSGWLRQTIVCMAIPIAKATLNESAVFRPPPESCLSIRIEWSLLSLDYVSLIMQLFPVLPV